MAEYFYRPQVFKHWILQRRAALISDELNRSRVGNSFGFQTTDLAMRSSLECELPTNVAAELKEMVRDLNGPFRHLIDDGPGVISSVKAIVYTKGDHFIRHRDRAVNVPLDDDKLARRITVIIGVADEDAYAGGELMLFDDGPKIIGSLKIGLGDCLLFPSTMLHEVARVEAGKRAVLVLWLN